MSDDQAKPVAQPETWVFIGRRFDEIEKKLYFSYLDASGVEVLYSKAISGTVVGARYEVYVHHHDGQTKVTLNKYIYRGRDEFDPRITGWTAADAVATTRRDTSARESRDKELNTFGDSKLDDLRRLASRMPTLQRRALIASVLEYLSRPIPRGKS